MQCHPKGGGECFSAESAERQRSATGDQPPEVAVVVVPRFDRGEAVASQIGCERDVLLATELEQQVTTGPQEPRRVLDDAPHDLQAVVTAVERKRRFVTLHVDGEESPVSSRHVRRHCGHDIDDAR